MIDKTEAERLTEYVRRLKIKEAKLKPVYISFYANNKRLGGAYVKQASKLVDRHAAARRIGILSYNRVIFENRSPKADIWHKNITRIMRAKSFNTYYK